MSILQVSKTFIISSPKQKLKHVSITGFRNLHCLKSQYNNEKNESYIFIYGASPKSKRTFSIFYNFILNLDPSKLMSMRLLDLLAEVAKEEKIKLDEEEEERKKRDQEQVLSLPKNGIQLEPMAKSKGKRSNRREPTTSMERPDDQKISDNLHEPDSDPAAEETSDHQEKKVEEEFKKVNKVGSDNDNNDDDYGLNHKKDKKRKVIIVGFDSPPLSKEFKERITATAEGGLVGKEIKVIEKTLTRTDVQIAQNRFSIPANQMMGEFLLPEELEFLKKRAPDGFHCNTIEVKIIEPSRKVQKVSLSRWEMRKEFGQASVSYVLKGNWKKVLTENQLQEGQMVQLWAVRVGVKKELCLAFVVVRSRKQKEEGRTCKTTNVDNGTNNNTPVSCVGGEAKEAKASLSGGRDGEAEEAKAGSSGEYNGQAEAKASSSGVANVQSEPEYHE